MALPFILGLAVGAGAIIAFNNKDKLKNKTAGLLDKSKDFAEDTFEKTKKNVSELKDKLCTKKEEVKSEIKEEIEKKIKD